MQNSSVYDDMLHLPHHTSRKHPHMDRIARAAQFAPFAALTGHGEAIRETARQTQQKRELDENSRELLDYRLQVIRSCGDLHPELCVTFFVPDEKKDGGRYETIQGKLKKIDTEARVLVMEDERRIPIAETEKIEGKLFQEEGDLWYD